MEYTYEEFLTDMDEFFGKSNPSKCIYVCNKKHKNNKIRKGTGNLFKNIRLFLKGINPYKEYEYIETIFGRLHWRRR